MRLIRSLFSSAMLLAAAGSPVLAAEAGVYRLAPGDVVEVDLGGMVGQQHRLVVQFDGSISLPAAGSVQAEGLTVAELQDRLEVVLSSWPMRVRVADGREQLVVFQPGDVTATVAEYRPVYVTGTVRSPGQQAFRPQMTVRQAMAVAGGFSAGGAAGAPEAGGNPLEVQAAYRSLWLDQAKEMIRGARLAAELRGADTFSVDLPAGAPVEAGLVQALHDSEAEALAISNGDRKVGRTYTATAIKDLDAMIEVLSKREAEEGEAVKADEDELSKVKQVFDKGLNTNARLGDVRRALLMSSSRLLETTVELMKLRQQKAEVARKAEQEENAWRVGLLRDVAESQARVGGLAAQIRAAGGRLQPGAAVPFSAGGPAIIIARRIGDGWQQLPVGQDAELLPGDVVEVSAGDGAEVVATPPVVSVAPAPEAAPAAPRATLHFAPNNNFAADGSFAPGAAGFDLADVSSIEQLARLPDGVRALVWVGMCDGVSAAFQERVTPFLGHPQVFGYYLMDEPDPTGRWHPECSPANLRAQSDWLHERDPAAQTFVMLMSYGPSEAATYDAAYGPEQTHVDLFGIDPYPCRSEFGGCKLDMIGRAVTEAVAAGYPQAALVPTFQAFGGGSWETSGGGTYLVPTLDQFEGIIARWQDVLPDPVFDYTYSWGVQQDDEALETTPQLRAAILKHNRRDLLDADHDS